VQQRFGEPERGNPDGIEQPASTMGQTTEPNGELGVLLATVDGCFGFDTLETSRPDCKV